MAIIIGTTNGETLTGTDSNDEIYALGGDDIVEGGDGDDLIDGGDGVDTMTGGAGDDVYVVNSGEDVIVEQPGGGTDEVRSAAGYYYLPNFVENLVGLSSLGQNLGGNSHDNIIIGGAGTDSIWAGTGDDTILHSGGGDSVDGGAGYDVYVLPGTAADYAFTRTYGVRVQFLSAPGEADVTLYEIEAVRFEGDGSTFDFSSYFDRYGTSGPDTLVGDNSHNLIYGFEGDDVIYAHGGDDFIDGGAGDDFMDGGAGHDRYIVDSSSDVVIEAAGGGIDYIELFAASYTMGANIEDLDVAYAGNATVIGNASANRINGLYGDDRIEGGGGNDVLSGGGGDDTMIGGAGNDSYYVTDDGDLVVETAGGGIDWVEIGIASYTLPAHVENAAMTGAYYSDVATLVGNGLANVIEIVRGAHVIDGGSGSDTIGYESEWQSVTIDLLTGENGGGAADDTLISIENISGSWYDDSLYGTAGANTLNGAFGADLMVGRGGNDIYFVDNQSDQVVEAPGEGTDEVRLVINMEYVLPENVEKLRSLAQYYTVVTGNALNNEMTGGPGEDWFYGGDGQDNLSGGAGNDFLFGEAGSDTMSGGTGVDEMTGGEGNDVYIVDNPGDVVIELAGEGTDQVFASTAAYTLPGEIENLNYNAYGDFHGVGNDYDNVIYGGSGADILEGLGGNDELRGNGGNDVLLGGDGNDLIVGASGTDTLTGGAGADLFRISSYESGLGSLADRIADFTIGEDLIDLANIDAEFWTPGDQAFTFVGDAAFSGTAGELRYSWDGSDTWLQGDTDGDGTADFEIVLTGELLLSPSDFML